MKGIIALHGNRSKRDFTKRIRKPKSVRKYRIFCYMCGKEISYARRNKKYCGNRKDKDSCSYKKLLLQWRENCKKIYQNLSSSRVEYLKKYRAEHKDYFKDKLREFYKRKVKA